MKLSNLSHVPCKFYKQGTCTAGANCTFSHNSDLSSESAVCKYFIKGNCKFGTKCALLHTMSPYNRYMLSTSPPIARKKVNTADQIMMSSNAFSPQQRSSYLHDFAAGTSAPPAISFFQHFAHHSSPHNNDFVGLLPPRETNDLLYGGGLNGDNNQLSSSVRSTTQYYHKNDYSLNDSSVMLPSSLNDLFTTTSTPANSIARAVNYQSYYSDNIGTATNNYHSFTTTTSNNSRMSPSHWNRGVPFIRKSSNNNREQLALDDEIDRLIEGTAAINIPGMNNSSGSNSDGSSGSSYLFSPPEEPASKFPSFYPQEDEEVQFFMEEIVNDSNHKTFDMTSATKNNALSTNKSSSNSNNNSSYAAFPSLVSLPSI
ncbi:MAG: hypothetical protein EXX96DRAFT_533894 [Benjaminiella poitrasii]|nr:MAG: hypothetical protein EXX96DRAFT_533894 [Benjaminiella poitrasii]